jgi:hypothetical protein
MFTESISNPLLRNALFESTRDYCVRETEKHQNPEKKLKFFVQKYLASQKNTTTTTTKTENEHDRPDHPNDGEGESTL